MNAQISGFNCFKCNKTFFSQKTLINHIKFIHPFLIKYECKQTDCSRSYKDLNGLRKHLRLQHTNNEHGNSRITTFQRKTFPIRGLEPNDASQTIGNDFGNIISCHKDYETNIEDVVSEFVMKLYANSSLNRSIIQFLMIYTKELVDNIFSFIRNKVSNSEPSLLLPDLFKEISHTFNKFGTEYRRMQYLQNMDVLVRPNNFTIGTSSSLRQIETPGYPQFSVKTVRGQKICIKLVLKAFLQLPNVITEMKAFIESEENANPDLYSSVFQGRLWKSLKQNFIGKTVFPILLFFDDFEPLNPLGSRAGIYKIGCVYISLACVPTEYSSLLENIFLAQLFYSSDRNVFGNEKIFQNLIEDLLFLETEGLFIETNGEQKEKIYFVLLLVLGDNLGLNSVLGFTESFNSEFFCRICLTPKIVSQTEVNPTRFVIRTRENYDQDCLTLAHGIKERCIWHMLPNFHLTKNFSCDFMHDVLEGVLRYDMAFIIGALLNKKYFNLEQLNNRIKFFKFSKADTGNPIPQIKMEHLKKKYIIMSASEMLALTSYFGLLVGDLVPETEPVWDFYIIVLNILDILLQRQFSEQLIEYLQLLIKEHHIIFKDLFNENLRPKYHFLMHYPEVIRNIGPPRFYWSMRYEAFHRLLKSTANSVTCRKNLLITLSLKQQLRLSYRLHTKTGFCIKTEFGPQSLIERCILEKVAHFTERDMCVSWVKVNNILYKKDFALHLDKTDFAIIKNVVICDSSIFFVLQPLQYIGFCHHYQAHEVKVIVDKRENLFCKSFNELISKQVYNIHYAGDGHSFITTIK